MFHIIINVTIAYRCRTFGFVVGPCAYHILVFEFPVNIPNKCSSRPVSTGNLPIMAKIIIKETEVNVVKIGEEDYICFTDMMKAKDGDFFITDWLRNRNTLEFIGIWEKVYNPNFNYGEFAIIKNQAGLNSFKISVKEFVAKTNAISLQAKAGIYGGTYAHKDIAFEFAMWVSPFIK